MLLKALLGFACLIGLAMTGFGIYFIALGNAARTWPEAEGRVVSTQIRSETSSSGDATRAQIEASRRYYPEINYGWSVDGESYSGSRYQLGTTHAKYKTRTEARAAAAKYPEGSTIAVYFDPKDPSQAVLDRAMSAGVFVPLPLGLLFLAAGLMGFRYREQLQAAAAAGSSP
jgi:hypothetical protein